MRIKGLFYYQMLIDDTLKIEEFSTYLTKHCHKCLFHMVNAIYCVCIAKYAEHIVKLQITQRNN